MSGCLQQGSIPFSASEKGIDPFFNNLGLIDRSFSKLNLFVLFSVSTVLSPFRKRNNSHENLPYISYNRDK